jgi:hypothetical protein
VIVNDSTDYRIDAMPFGGVKGSGLGREGVRFALEEMTEPKVVCLTCERTVRRYQRLLRDEDCKEIYRSELLPEISLTG